MTSVYARYVVLLCTKAIAAAWVGNTTAPTNVSTQTSQRRNGRKNVKKMTNPIGLIGMNIIE